MMGATNVTDWVADGYHPSFFGYNRMTEAIATGRGKYRGHDWYDLNVYTNPATINVTNASTWLTGGDLAASGDAYEWEASGVIQNAVNTHTIGVTFGTETIASFGPAALIGATNSWTMSGTITKTAANVQRCQTTFTSTFGTWPTSTVTTNTSAVDYIANQFAIRASSTSSGGQTNNYLHIRWKPVGE